MEVCGKFKIWKKWLADLVKVECVEEKKSVCVKCGWGTSVLMASDLKHCCHILSYSVSLCCFVYVERFSRGKLTDSPGSLRPVTRRWNRTDPEVGPRPRTFGNSYGNLSEEWPWILWHLPKNHYREIRNPEDFIEKR